MKTTRTLLLVAGLVISTGLLAGTNNALPAQNFTPVETLQPDEYMANTMIVNVLPAYRNACSANHIDIPALNDFFLMIGADRVEKMFPLHKAPEKAFNEYGAPMEDISLIYIIHYNGAMPLPMAMGKIYRLGYFEYAQPYYIPKVDFVPNDAQASQAGSYHLYKIVAAGAGTTGWDISQGSTSITIGIVDTGTELTHSDLTNQIQYNTADPLSGGDDDGDGFVNNYRGWDVAMNDNDPTWQSNAHGVHVSGCASAQVNNSIGVAGSGFNCKFLPVKIADASGTLTASYQGITYAADHGCDVINCSWGGTGGGPFEQQIIDYATNNMDALVVAASGNNSADQAFFPASLDKVLSVSSTGASDARSSFTNYNYTVDVCAPGSNINSTWTSNGYTLSSGTSMASPVCAGAAAIVRAFYPAYNAVQAGERLKMTTDDIYSISPNNQATYADKLGTGRINLYRALTDPASISVAYVNRVLVDNNDDVFVIGDTIRITGDFWNYLGATSNLTATMSVVTAGGFVTVLDGTTNPGAVPSFSSVGHNPDPFTVKVNANAPLNQSITLKVTLTDGAWSYDQYIVIVVNVDYINIAINDVATSITSKGLIGYNADAQQQGLGFTYMGGGTLLYESSFMVGVAGNVNDRARGTGATPDTDLASLLTVRENTATVSDMDVDGYFRDNTAATAPLPVTVHHYAYAWTTSPNTKYVMVKYVIQNTGGSTLNNVYGGIFADWDIDAATFGQNKGNVDNTNRMGYCYYSGSGGLYAGIKLLSNTGGFNHYAIDNISGGAGGIDMFNGYDDADKYTTLSTNRAQSGVTGGGNDVCHVVSSGPFTIAAGDSVTVAFALIAGDDLADLQNSAIEAQNMYDTNVPTGITMVGDNTSGMNVYPNPANNNAELSYSVTQSGTTDVRMYDVAGREVSVIAQGSHAVGTYRATLNTAILPEGVYIIRMVSGDAITTRRIVITH
ncbi:MAG TPA: S8/S53 family peptidase [Bacteroidia bacterium]|nr:S8/S53 family peptidase [Bacteroidia bacterium]